MTFDPAIFGARTVGLIGSCVARDFKEVAFGSAERSVYIWRMNTISAVSPAPSELRYDLPLTHDESLTFYSDLNKVDLRKKFADSDVLLVDFFRDTYPAGVLKDGRAFTLGAEYQKYNLAERMGLDHLIDPYKPDYIDHWWAAFEKLADILADIGKPVIIVPTYGTYGVQIENRYDAPANFDSYDIRYKNKLVHFMERIAALRLAQAYLLPFPREYCFLDPNHIYGVGPFHMQVGLYDRMFDAAAHFSEEVIDYHHLSPGQRAEKINYLLDRWRDEARRGY